MKIRVTMKDPDTLDDSVRDAVAQSFLDSELSTEEVEAASEVRREKMRAACDRWFKWGEYLTVEIDTDAGTCVVVEASK